MKKRRISTWLFLFTLLLSLTARAQEMTLDLDPANTKIEITLPAFAHTVHGNFSLKSGTVHFNPATGSTSGLIVVDAASGNTGNDGRDHKMHTQVLESRRYSEITFTPNKLSGTVNLQGNSDVQVEGVLSLHGSEYPITLPLTVQATSNSLTAKTHIVIPYVSWGLKNPSTFLLRVSEKVDVDISASGRLSPP